MPPKKSAKKVAKKAAGKHGPHKTANDARRTFEHLGRVQALSALIASEDETLSLLTNLADSAFRAQQCKESADLLRAAEHYSFATIHAGFTETVAWDIRNTITEEFEHLVERMEEHATEHSAAKPLQQLRTRFHREANAALHRGSYRAALEFARGAEALAHVHSLDTKELPLSVSQKRLRR
jgi:hypothetical protein